jgi:hypothetical protein
MIKRAIVLFLVLASPAMAHSWYSKKQDPIWRNACCGGSDCSEIDGQNISGDVDGYRIILSLEEARKINKNAQKAIDTVVEWARVQPSEDSKYHICVMSDFSDFDRRHGVYCFFAPLGL